MEYLCLHAMNLPQPFIDQLTPIIGNELDDFLTALQQDPPTSVRTNDKIHLQAGQAVAWCNTGYYLDKRPLFTVDPLFHAGAYYVQEASSMFVEQAIKQYIKNPVNMLDLCAAPGGKSTHLSSLLPPGSLLVSNEVVRSRAYILSENMMKWGNANVVVTNNEAGDFEKFHSFFDAVLIDAPCSGEGMFRKDKEAIAQWSPENVRKCVDRQRTILSTIWPALKTGGMAIYSTCTYNRHENEENVRWIIQELGAELLSPTIEPEWGITVSDAGYRFYPHKTKGEGFFMAVLQKTSDEFGRFKPQKEKRTTKIAAEIGMLKNNLLAPEEWEISTKDNIIRALPLEKANDINQLEQRLKIIHSGILLAEQKGKDFIPEAALSLSKHLDISRFNTVDVALETAIRFLQKESIELPQAAKGYVLLTYRHVPIGWVKNLGKRCNNLYPNEWRIRMKNIL
jgi:16S rRNA C967 or C1407 C5-methylase (RsmB/RsmF family)/NOL1/NOP2/fmu family ribosome biogenesis protein